jgi:PAS domain S-box-containing protein
MNTFIANNLPSKIDSSILNTLKTSSMTDNLDDLLEAYLTHILHMPQVRQSEILFFDTGNTLVPVAKSKWIGPPHEREAKVYSESWILDHSVKHTAKRIERTQIQSVFSLPLMDSGAIMGFLNIRLEKLYLIEQNQLNQFHLIGMQLSGSIREIRLKSQIKQISEDLHIQTSNNTTLLHSATSLSKELYAISAISTRINQSMDFDKTLQRCLTTIRKVFKASSILIYTKNDANSKIELVDCDCEDVPANKELRIQRLQNIGKIYLKEVLQSTKPLVKKGLEKSLPELKEVETEPHYTSLIGIALNSRNTTVGAMMLLYSSPESTNYGGLRLLSGLASIMAMAFANMALYRQSTQKKNEIDFLFRSIVQFNKTLDLKATLTSVAEKGVEYCGFNSCVYLFSQTSTEVIISRYEKHKKGYVVSSSLPKKIAPKELKRVYLELFGLISKKSLLIRSIGRCKKITKDTAIYFNELNINSLVAVPLRVGQKKRGMLLLARDRKATSFGQHELRFAEALASAASLTIENARAYAASQEMSDFLEKKISEKTSQILQIQARQRIRVENRKDIIFQVNRYNRFVFANKAMEIFSGLPRDILCHKDFIADRVVAAEERAYVRGLFRKILSKQIPMVKDAEYRHISHKGDDHIISLTIFPEYDQHGRVVGVEGVGRDVTEKKRLETKLKKTRELALLGEFSGAMAHQMRNPLGNILMGTKRLEAALGLDGGKWGINKDKDSSLAVANMGRTRIAEILKNLSQGVYNLNQVVTELLEYTKTFKLCPSLQRMDIIISETVQTFANLIVQHQIKVYEYFQDNLPHVPVDAVLIGQVMQNVVYNAIQAMPRGGELALFASLTEKNPDHILLSIRDTGIGIDPSVINQIFHPFYTTKTQGTGLGLSVAHRIVEAHGGMIQVCRNPCLHVLGNNKLEDVDLDQKTERGTTVHIMLPVAVESDKKLMRQN